MKLSVRLLSQNLDVNVAVNNLLSRDDEDGGSEQEDVASINILPAGGVFMGVVRCIITDLSLQRSCSPC